MKRSRRIAIESLMIVGLTSGPAILAQSTTATPQTPSSQTQSGSMQPNFLQTKLRALLERKLLDNRFH